MKKYFLTFITLALFMITAEDVLAQKKDSNGFEVRFQPDSMVYVYENIGPEMSKQLFTAVIQNMAFVNTSNQPVVLKKAAVDVLSEGNIIQTHNITSKKIKLSAAKFKMFQDQGILDLYDFQFQTSRYLNQIKLSANDTLNSGEAIIITHETFLFDELPDRIEVSITGHLLNNKEVKTLKGIKVVNHKSKNDYILPIKGIWTAAAGPSLIGHHRWGSVQEFAFDFIKIGSDQRSYRNSGTALEDYYAYGEPVFAIGDGVVVSSLDGILESSDNLKRPDESESDYLMRLRPYQEKLMSKGFKYVFGNHVVIKHANSEYSVYFHLKNQSVKFKAGETVKQGEIIGQIGHSGNSTEPHLHFHVSDGIDIAYSRGIPVEFNNIVLYPADNGTIRHIASGQIIKTKEQNDHVDH